MTSPTQQIADNQIRMAMDVIRGSVPMEMLLSTYPDISTNIVSVIRYMQAESDRETVEKPMNYIMAVIDNYD